jgi:hypothetical protein
MPKRFGEPTILCATEGCGGIPIKGRALCDRCRGKLKGKPRPSIISYGIKFSFGKGGGKLASKKRKLAQRRFKR